MMYTHLKMKEEYEESSLFTHLFKRKGLILGHELRTGRDALYLY